MSKQKINISISGGNSEFGNFVQGDKNTISFEKHSQHLDDFYTEIQQLRDSSKVTQDQINSLKEEIRVLAKSSNEYENISATARKLYEQYSWAIGPLQKLFSVIIP